MKVQKHPLEWVAAPTPAVSTSSSRIPLRKHKAWHLLNTSHRALRGTGGNGSQGRKSQFVEKANYWLLRGQSKQNHWVRYEWWTFQGILIWKWWLWHQSSAVSWQTQTHRCWDSTHPFPQRMGVRESQPRAAGAGLDATGRDCDPQRSSALPPHPRRGRFVLFHSQHLVAHFQVLAPRHRQIINVSEEPLRYWLICLFPSQWVFMVSRLTVTIVTSQFFSTAKGCFPRSQWAFYCLNSVKSFFMSHLPSGLQEWPLAASKAPSLTPALFVRETACPPLPHHLTPGAALEDLKIKWGMLRMRISRHCSHRSLIFLFLEQDLKNISWWKWEVCSACTSWALLCKASDSKWRWKSQSQILSRPQRAPAHSCLFPGTRSAGRKAEMGLQWGEVVPRASCVPGLCRAHTWGGKALSSPCHQPTPISWHWHWVLQCSDTLHGKDTSSQWSVSVWSQNIDIPPLAQFINPLFLLNKISHCLIMSWLTICKCHQIWRTWHHCLLPSTGIRLCVTLWQEQGKTALIKLWISHKN